MNILLVHRSRFLAHEYFQKVILLVVFCLIQVLAYAQCSPQLVMKNGSLGTKDTFCQNELISFRTSSPGFNTSVTWDFGDGSNSTDNNPTYSFNKAGHYTIKFTGTGPVGTCTDSIYAIINPSPEIGIELITASQQCFKDNNFCFRDTSKSREGSIMKQIYLFSDGFRFDTIFPKGTVHKDLDFTFCHSIYIPSGGMFDLEIESLDKSGCKSRKVYQDYIHIQPNIGINFNNITPKPNPGCDSTLGVFDNTSSVPLADVDTFIWNWGDGASNSGNCTTNTEWWHGINNDNKIQHMYTSNGSFDVTLEVSAYGCTEKFTWKNAVGNFNINPSIVHHPTSDIISASENPIKFSVANLPSVPGVQAFLWNFGEPQTGPYNTNDRTLIPEHSFSLGPHLVSLRILAGNCDVTLLDTFQIVGPQAKIEDTYDRIAFNEKFQCGTADSVHFPNNSSFYQNDDDKYDEDSLVIVNGKELFAFNYTPPIGKGGSGIGDQTAQTSSKHIANRNMGSPVWRIWNFGDEYAPQCTTSTAKGINLNKNCNWSEDEYPVHKYQSWDTVYYHDYFLTNDSFQITKYNDSLNSCYIELIDTTNLALHRKIFDKTIPHKFTARLWLRDTINQIESFDEVLIDHTRPDASLMTLSSGIPCPFNGYSLDYVLNFKLNTGTQSYFAVNFDSIANPTGFIPYDQGILAPPSPGLPIPFVLPYDIRGSLGDEFVKGYTQGEVGSDPKLRSPNGSFTMGLIVGNGPSVGSSPATCLDTAWYRDIFRIPYLNASFDILSPATSIKSICAGESAYFNIQKPIQNDISILRWAWGYQGLGKGPNLDLYVEQFTYMEKYDGPSPTRNDRNIAYNGEDWYYNYVVRGGINDALGFHTTDTIVTSIVKDWKIETKFNNVEDIQLFTNGLGYNEIDKKDLHKLWGDGTFGCIDTTGLSNLVEINKKEYRNYNGDNVFLHGDKRYRYTDESKTDSIEVAHILHFRDSSLQGYDTLIQGADTTFGVWKKQYRHAKINNGDTAYHASSGPMVPTLFLNNTSGCESRSAELLNVGFQNDYWFENDDALCSGLNLFIKDDIRYYQYGEEDPFTYPINAYPYWQDPVRYVNNSEYHIVDWDSADSWNPQRSIVLNHLYTEPGIYTITIVAKDSMGCKDTTYLTKEITEISIDFEYDTLINSCEGKTDFLDKTSTSSSSDEISTWEWDFGDGTRKSLLQNPTHTYSRSGFFDVKLIVRSSSGCMDSVMKRILVAGPQPEFEFANNPGMIGDTIEIYVSDSINVNNLSKGVGIKDPTFAMDWGDGSFSSPPRDGQSFGHSYTQSGIYNLYLIMEAALPNGYRCSKIYPDTISKAHTVVVRVLPDSLNNIREINNRILIYPNPSTGSFSIEIEDGTKLLTVKLYDLLSREVSIEMLDSTTSYKVLDKIVSGTYLLKVHTEQGIITKKLLFNMD